MLSGTPVVFQASEASSSRFRPILTIAALAGILGALVFGRLSLAGCTLWGRTMPFKVQVGPPQIAIHQGQTVLITEQNGEIGWPSDKGLYFFDTRVISRRRQRSGGRRGPARYP